MDTEEFDLDTLVDLLEEDHVSQSANPSETTSAASFQEQTLQKESTPALKKKLNVSVDLFSKESSNTDIKLLESDKNKDNEIKELFGSDSSDDEDNKTNLTKTGKMIKKNIIPKNWFDSKPQRQVQNTWKSNSHKLQPPVKQNSFSAKDSCLREEFSGIRIINPLVAQNVLKSRMNGRKMIKMSYIKNYIRNGDIEGDWVTIGVLVNKLPPKTSKNGKTYSIWKMSDLHDVEKIVCVFLFGAVHVEHWKASVGTVVGILNPSFMSNKDGYKATDITLCVDQPTKLMMMGTSDDLGQCKSVKKDGSSCTNIVNKSQCEYCTYHVTKQYKKVSSKRVELQASYSGRPVDLKKRVLNKSNIMYGGQMFCSSNPKPITNSRSSKDKLVLNGLGLKRKAEELEKEASNNLTNNIDLSKVHKVETDKVIKSKSEFINRQLSKPTFGARNLFKHLVKAENAKIVQKSPIVSITPKELLKMHESEMRRKRAKLDNPSPASVVPQLGRGLRPGGEVLFDITPSSSKKNFSKNDMNKLQAIRKIQQNGPIKSQNPNAVKSEKQPKSVEKIKSILDKDEEVLKPEIATSVLGTIDYSSDKIKKILERKSSHAYEIEIDELEKLEKYFNTLEMKEKMEEKMSTTFQITCNVVSCRNCEYTSHQALDRCKSGGHLLICHTATKRFFSCLNCKYRTCAFTKLPKRPCRKCGEKSFEKTSMMRPRSGPKLESEKLNIRGDEVKFLNSLK